MFRSIARLWSTHFRGCIRIINVSPSQLTSHFMTFLLVHDNSGTPRDFARIIISVTRSVHEMTG